MNNSQNGIANKTFSDTDIGAAADINGRHLAQRFQIVKFAAVSYLVDALFLFALSFTGAIGIMFSVGYLGAGLIAIAAISLMYKTGLNLRFRHPSLGMPFLLYGIFLQLAALYLSPAVGFFFILNTFSVFSFGPVALSTSQFLMVLGVSSAAAIAVFGGVSGDIGFPVTTLHGKALLLLAFLLVLGRCVVLGMYVSRLRASLRAKNKALQESHQRIEELASHDELTEVPNRRSLMKFLLEEKTRADRADSKFCVAIFDLDHFKSVNDNFGHVLGDKVLKEFAATVCAVSREMDRFGRLGGEEFLLVLPLTALEDAMMPLERIRDAVNNKAWHQLQEGLRVTVSVGVSEYRENETIEQFLERADVGLYAAKLAGRNRIVIAG